MTLKLPAKAALLFITSLIFVTNVEAQTIFSYDNEKVLKEEFLNAYNKNKTQNENEKSFREYLDLYINYKLKVKEANILRIDTSAQIKTDIQNFRKQLQEGFLIDEAATTKLLNEALERGGKNLHIIHFFSPAKNDSDTLKAKEAITFAYTELKNGRNDYDKIAAEASIIYPVKFSDPGFLTAFSVPYNFENIIYNLNVGDASKPIKTPSGFHVFKCKEIRKDIGKWKIAQILIAIEPTASSDEINAAKQKADSVYKLLKDGMDFGTAAMKFSDDKLSYSIGGELPEFGSGKYAPEFESRAISLSSDGDFSSPFKTSYGFHILKRIHVSPYDGPNDQSVIYETRQKLLKDDRIQPSTEKFNSKIGSVISPKYLKIVPQSELFRLADSVISDLTVDNSENFKESKSKIIQYKNSYATVADWLKYVRNYYLSSELNKGDKGIKLWDKFIIFSNREYYKNNLEQYNPQFKAQLNEFLDGNLLFEIMERNVWNKSSSDTIGLKKYYEAHKDLYHWQKSAEILAVSTVEPKDAEAILGKLKAGSKLENVESEFPEAHFESGRYELNQIAGLETLDNIEKGAITPLNSSPEGGSGFIMILETFPAGEQKSFEDAKGAVISDYQNLLESEWVKTLRKKYKVKINESEVQSTFSSLK